MEKEKYKVKEPLKLKSWENYARIEIQKWLANDSYSEEITNTIMKNENIGPFTKFLYYFGFRCESPWGVMIDFDERKQRIFLTNHYYKWMHKLRDEIQETL